MEAIPELAAARMSTPTSFCAREARSTCPREREGRFEIQLHSSCLDPDLPPTESGSIKPPASGTCLHESVLAPGTSEGPSGEGRNSLLNSLLTGNSDVPPPDVLLVDTECSITYSNAADVGKEPSTKQGRGPATVRPVMKASLSNPEFCVRSVN